MLRTCDVALHYRHGVCRCVAVVVACVRVCVCACACVLVDMCNTIVGCVCV